MNIDIHEKLADLKEILRKMGKIAIAYSGGVDSTFLLRVAHDTLKENAIAITARSSTYPEREYNEAVSFVKTLGVKHVTIVSEELDIEGFSGNPVNRCYFCKKELFTKISAVARENGISYIADGSNTDDLGDYRPGLTAMKELGVVSPLREAGMSKDDIRALSKEMNLPTWDKQAFACLASRFPYGQEITHEKLSIIDKAEQYMLDLGFKQVRVRMHEDLARIEVSAGERKRFYDEDMMNKIHDKMKEIGFKYVTLDLKGYRTGSMNEVLVKENK